MSDIGVDLVVVNYRTPGDLARFCMALAAEPPSIPWSLTIANVCPEREDDRLGKWFSSAERTGIGQADRLVYDHFIDNVGYARACNQSAARGNHPFLALFNADVIIAGHQVDACVKALAKNNTWGVLGPRQVDDHGMVTHGGIFGTQQKPHMRAWRIPNAPSLADVREEAVNVSGSAYFARRSMWDDLTACPEYRKAAPEALGAFLPTPHYFEERFCSAHAIHHGWKTVYYGPVCIIHNWHKASPVGGWAERQFPTSRALYREACDIHGMEHE